MNEFDQARKLAFERLSTTQTTRVLELSEKTKAGFKDDFEVWEVVTEVAKGNLILDVKLNIVFKKEFPIHLPKVYLSKASFDLCKYLPHTQADGLICTYEDDAQLDPALPAQGIEELITRARRILEDGFSGKNVDDYQHEFVAYWQQAFHEKDKCLRTVLLLISAKLQEDFKVLLIPDGLRGFEFVIHQEEDEALRFKTFLEHHKIKFQEHNGFYLGKIDTLTKPPFELTVRDSIKLVQKNAPDAALRFVRYLNKIGNVRFVVFSKEIQNSDVYLGWMYPAPDLARNGFRPGVLTPLQVFQTFQGGNYLKRFMTESLGNARLMQRTAGSLGSLTRDLHTKIAIAGLGSIGSNLLHFFSVLENVSFRLIDPDVLKIENIGRHLLGFNYVGASKVKALKEHLQLHNPTLDVMTREVGVIDTINDEPDFINNCSCLIVAIGNLNIEKWIAKRIASGVLKIPILFVWVEPYLAGGHCIFVPPLQTNFEDLFDSSGLFIHNVICKEEYNRPHPLLSLKEAGCQTAYTPYSGYHTILFLSALFPILTKLFQNGEKQTCAFSWVGDVNAIEKLGVKCCGDYDAQSFNTIITRNL